MRVGEGAFTSGKYGMKGMTTFFSVRVPISGLLCPERRLYVFERSYEALKLNSTLCVLYNANVTRGRSPRRRAVSSARNDNLVLSGNMISGSSAGKRRSKR